MTATAEAAIQQTLAATTTTSDQHSAQFLSEQQHQKLAASICSNLSQWMKMTCNQEAADHHQNDLLARPMALNLLDPTTKQQQHSATAQLIDLLRFTTSGGGTNECANSASMDHNSGGSFLYRTLAANSSSSLADGDYYFNQQPQTPTPLTSFVRNYLVDPMQSVETKLDYYFSDSWQGSGDERTSRFPLMAAGPWKLIYATLVYLLLIKWLLPKLMRPMKPLELNWPIRIYNLSMVVSNMWACYHGARILNFGLKCFGCEVINHRDYSSEAIELIHYGWLFFVSRLIEWFDTIFFVLRKKERQVTKLHVFHHSFVPLISWTYLKYHPGYTVAFFPFVNTFVHSIMYTYYFLATFGPSVQPYLWWKRYLTSLQIAQFVLILIQLASIPLTGNDKCQYPRGFLYVAFAGAILFLWLFFTYYIDTYSKHKGGQKQDDKTLTTRSGLNDKSSSIKRAATSAFNQREGSSRALSDAIDNAIVSEEPFVELYKRTSMHIKNKEVV